MDVTSFIGIHKEIKFSLIFFCLALVGACGRGDTVNIEQVDYENEKAVGVTFSTEMDVENVRVFVGEESKTSVIGVIVSNKNEHSFTPVIPFTAGQAYTLRKSDTVILAAFTIPERTKAEKAELTAIYPQSDTVPENLLKMYFEFAQPMQEVGNALDFITVTNDTDGVETQPFLRLESELWNRERAVLTLWLDPGRIKTDLIPNREKGLPLSSGKTYTVAIDPNWKSAGGMPLKREYSKTFFVGPRDDRKPEIEKWRLQLRQEDSLQPLNIDFGEPMDAFLAVETIRILGSDSMRINGRFNRLEKGSALQFVPNSHWDSPEIEIRVESRLEDLAGNNLNRLFDTDLKNSRQEDSSSLVKTILFKVNNP